jgi:quinol monooxygenase YgiN
MTSGHVSVIAIGDLFGISGGREELLAAFAQAAREAAGQPGCVRYSFAEAVGDRDHFILISEWRDKPSMEAHYGSDRFEDFQRSLHGLLARPSELMLYSISGSVHPVARAEMDPRDAD